MQSQSVWLSIVEPWISTIGRAIGPVLPVGVVINVRAVDVDVGHCLFLSATQTRFKCIAQSVAEEIKGKHGNGKRQRREKRLIRIGTQCANPRRSWSPTREWED